MKKRKSYIKVVTFISILMMIDQFLKVGLIENSLQIIPGILKITYVQNTGGAFGIGQGDAIQVIIINAIVLGIVGRFLILQFGKMNSTTKIILSLILAGGGSNLLDRITRGVVIDYIDITQLVNFPIFNLADVYVVIGWIMLVIITIIYTFKDIRSSQEKKEA